ncbi:MAG: protein-L-isoaspartate O-methyltransferase family protein [Pseudonocardiaceae bacterium]
MPETLATRLAAYAASLREVCAIRSDIVERAFATVERHRCVPQFHYGPKTITVPQDQPPDGEVLDLVYSHQSLLTSTGGNGAPPSSSSAPTLMARTLEALDLQPGMRVLEIGAGTGYNAALIATITGAPVITIDAGITTTQGAAESIRRLGLDHQVTVHHGDGYLGEPSAAPPRPDHHHLWCVRPVPTVD